eukprot:1136787-Pelagomonas_calceolata.AAC.11
MPTSCILKKGKEGLQKDHLAPLTLSISSVEMAEVLVPPILDSEAQVEAYMLHPNLATEGKEEKQMTLLQGQQVFSKCRLRLSITG